MTASTRQPNRMNHAYFVGDLGRIYAYRFYPVARMAPLTAILQISVTGESIKMIVEGKSYTTTAHVTRPSWLEIHSGDVPVVSFMFYANTAMFRALRNMPNAFMSLPRDSFDPLTAALERAIEGNLTHQEAHDLFVDAVEALTRFFPDAPPLDERVAKVLSMLEADCDIPIAQLAHAVSLSPDRLSHLVVRATGFNLRRYRLALKIKRGMALYRPGMSMGELAKLSGFSDSAHLSRATREILGASPNFFIQYVQVHH